MVIAKQATDVHFHTLSRNKALSSLIFVLFSNNEKLFLHAQKYNQYFENKKTPFILVMLKFICIQISIWTTQQHDCSVTNMKNCFSTFIYAWAL